MRFQDVTAGKEVTFLETAVKLCLMLQLFIFCSITSWPLMAVRECILVVSPSMQFKMHLQSSQAAAFITHSSFAYKKKKKKKSTSNIQKGIIFWESPPTGKSNWCTLHECDVLVIWYARRILRVILKISCDSLQILATLTRNNVRSL